MRHHTTINEMAAGFDLIGDVHGDADRLVALLRKLDYKPIRGGWSHMDGRKVVYLGDLVDRGPKVRETLTIARAMVDAGTALMVLGNHELNLLCLLTSNGSGGHFRPHTERNLTMCRATLAAFKGRDAELQHYLAWFRTLPLFLDLGGLRVVHAEWDSNVVATARGRSYLDDNFLRLATTKGTKEHRTIETLLKGSETPLPHGATTTDPDGKVRHDMRICWPLPAAGRSYRDIAFASGALIPDVPVPPEIANRITGYAPNSPPVFFGHYALKDHDHGLISPNAACLDHGCGKGGRLVAYRWNGERTLSAANFIST